jgi:hypothetical protein
MAGLIQLTDNLIQSMGNLDALQTLCFNLKVLYDDLPGQTLSVKCQSLVKFLHQRGRIQELAERCAREFANIDWTYTPDPSEQALFGPAQFTDLGAPAMTHALTALVDLMRSPAVFAAVNQCKTDLEQTQAQVGALADLKDVHDLLHRLQFDCYNIILYNAKSFPAVESAYETISAHRDILNTLVTGMSRAAEKPIFANDDMSWLDLLRKSADALSQAVDNMDAGALTKAIGLLKRILAQQPSRVNTRLNDKAQALRLGALVRDLSTVRDKLAHVPEADAAKVAQFRAGVESLASLESSLKAIVGDHNKWQAVEDDLRLFDAEVDQGVADWQSFWPDVKSKVNALCVAGAQWSADLQTAQVKVDQSIAGALDMQIRVSFRAFRNKASARFYEVDANLKEMCNQLRTLGEPLNNVLGAMKMMTP